jgi:hypothetical protein
MAPTASTIQSSLWQWLNSGGGLEVALANVKDRHVTAASMAAEVPVLFSAYGAMLPRRC